MKLEFKTLVLAKHKVTHYVYVFFVHLTQVRLHAASKRRAAMLCRVSTMAIAPYSAYYVIAQRFFIQPLGSPRWPAAGQKRAPVILVSPCNGLPSVTQLSIIICTVRAHGA